MHRFDMPERVKLLGGFCAMLTAKEASEWGEYVQKLPERAELVKVGDLIEMKRDAIQGGYTDAANDIEPLYARFRELEEKLFYAGKEWCAKFITADESTLIRSKLD